jgi:hypothetical protein
MYGDMVASPLILTGTIAIDDFCDSIVIFERGLARERCKLVLEGLVISIDLSGK